MNMEPDHFNEMRRLLAWKRNEQPPPQFFVQFPERVISRLLLESEPTLTFWQRLWGWLDAQPVLISAYGLAVCSLIFTGMRIQQVHVDNALLEQMDRSQQIPLFPSDGVQVVGLSNHTSALPIHWANLNSSSTMPIIHSEGDYGFRSQNWELMPAAYNFQ